MAYLLLVNGVDISPWWLFVKRDAGKMRHQVQHVGNPVDFLLNSWRGFQDARYSGSEFAHIAVCRLAQRRFVRIALVLHQGFTDVVLQGIKLAERAFLPCVEAECTVRVADAHDVSPLSLAASPAAVGYAYGRASRRNMA